MGANTFSYWEQTAFIDNADIVVIGSGLVGLNAALRLKQQQPALKVLVLERGFLPTGASTKNAGFACFGTVSEQLSYLKRSSEAEVLRMIDYKWRGLLRLRQNLGDVNIDYRQHGGYELFMNNEHERADEVISNLAYLNGLLRQIAGGADTYSVANDQIANFGFKGIRQMIFNPFEGQLHTGKMMRTLLNKVYEQDVLVLNNCAILQIINEGNSVVLDTSQGKFKTGRVVLATNAFASQLFPVLNVKPGRGQVLVTRPIANLKLKGTYHFNEGYYYFRNIDNRVLFGGGRNIDFAVEETWEFNNTEAVQQKLISYLKEIILPGQHFEPEIWWSGIMGFGDDLSPIVKQLEPNIFCAVRCNGMGVAMGSLVGEEVADLLLNTT